MFPDSRISSAFELMYMLFNGLLKAALFYGQPSQAPRQVLVVSFTYTVARRGHVDVFPMFHFVTLD